MVIVKAIIFDGIIWVATTFFSDGVYFDPKDNYEEWYQMNWIGVWVCTILYWIAFLPITIVYWVSAGIHKLFTFGRR
jgi:hypothetical protein